MDIITVSGKHMLFFSMFNKYSAGKINYKVVHQYLLTQHEFYFTNTNRILIGIILHKEMGFFNQ